MLQAFRQGIGSWFVKAFMGLLTLAFVLWGIADVFRNFGASSFAEIGKTKISQDTFRRAYLDRIQQLSQQLGRQLSPDQARAIGVDRQVLSELFGQIALDDNARKLGLGITDAALARKIEETPAFQGPGGGFNHDYFLQVIRSNGYTEPQFIDNERRVTLRQQIGRALGGDITAPKVLRDAIARYQNEERAIEFVMLGKNQAGTIPNPTPQELNDYYEAHKVAFRAPEYRKLTLIALTPETIAALNPVTDEELKKIFDSQIERFRTPEKREIDQIVFPNEEEAKAASGRLASGLSFDALAGERKLSPKDISLGTVTKRDILDPAVANAAFSLAAGQVSQPVTGKFGTVLVRVKKITPAIEPSFASAADTLRKEVSIQRARRDLLDLHDKIEDERASGSTLTEVATKLNLKALRIDAVDRSGRKPDGTQADEIPSRADVVAAAFRSLPRADNDPVELRDQGGYVWYEVAEIIPPRDRSFDEVRSLVESRWRDDEIMKKLAALSDTIRTKLESGEPLAKAAPGIAVEKREKLQRGRTVEGFDTQSMTRIFETAEGKSGVLETPDGIGRIVYRVVSAAVPPAAAVNASTDIALGRGLQDDLLSQYITKVENDLGVSIDEAALRSITGADRN